MNADGGPHRLADFTFPADGAWPDPRGMVEGLHGRGVKVLLWQIPLLKMRPHPRGQLAADARAAVAGGFVVTEADGRPYRNRGWWFPLALMPDLASEKARAWWTAKRRYLVDEVGIDGFKTDGGEHAWGARPAALRRSAAGAGRQQPVPGRVRARLRRPAAVGGQGAGDVQPGRVHRVAGARRVLGRRRGLDVGRRSEPR